MIYQGDVIQISRTADTGYYIQEKSPNDTTSLSVTGALTIITKFAKTNYQNEFIYIKNSSGKYEAYDVYIYNGTTWDRYDPYYYDTQWILCGDSPYGKLITQDSDGDNNKEKFYVKKTSGGSDYELFTIYNPSRMII